MRIENILFIYGARCTSQNMVVGVGVQLKKQKRKNFFVGMRAITTHNMTLMFIFAAIFFAMLAYTSFSLYVSLKYMLFDRFL